MLSRATAGRALRDSESRVRLSSQSADLLTIGDGAESQGEESSRVKHRVIESRARGETDEDSEVKTLCFLYRYLSSKNASFTVAADSTHSGLLNITMYVFPRLFVLGRVPRS